MAKKKLNEYFKKMIKAKKSNAPSFTHNGKKYVKKKTKSGLITYKKG